MCRFEQTPRGNPTKTTLHMHKRPDSYIPTIALVCILSLFGASASAQKSTFGRELLTVSISPVSAMLLTGATQQFTATVTGSRYTAVTWSSTGGTVSSGGLYIAPATAGTYSVTATSQADSTKSASATVTVTSPVVAVSISPVSASLQTGSTQQFTAYVTGSSNTAVTWSASGGTVSTNGLYTAPATAGTYSVTATSQADSTKSASATVTVTAPSLPLAFVQVAAATPQSPQSTVTVVYPVAQTAGNLNVVVVGWNDTTSNVTSVSDSRGNAYTLAVGPTSGTRLSQSIYYAKNIVSGSNAVTVTFNQAAASADIRILEYAGVDTVSPLDVTAAAVGNSNSANSGPATTTLANDLIFGADMVFTSTTAAGSGFTSRVITSSDGDIAEDKVVTTTGSNSATATLGSAGPWVMQMVAFKAAAGSTTPPAVTVSVSPSSTNLATDATQQFTATVTGTTNTAVTWSASCGTVTASGLYTAPTAAGSCTVTATSQADSTKSASATVTVTSPVVAVSISPVSASLQTGSTQQFTAYVTGSSNTAVTWSASGGTVSTNGLYTAPATAGTYSVTATSQADSTKSASATVTVTAPSLPLAFVQVAAATPQSPQSTVTVVYSVAQTAGNLNVVVVGWNDTTSNVTSVSDSRGNAYTLAVGPTSGTRLSQSIYYAKNIVSGSNAVTVTFNQAAASADIRILEYAGVDTVSPLDVTAAAVGNSNSANSGPATTTLANDLIFGADMVFTSTTAAGSGFTSRVITSSDGDIAEDKVVTTTGSNSATATLGSAGPWVMQMVAFKAAGGTTTPPAVTVSVSPSSTNLATDATQQFTATVTGTTNTAVTWSASCGTVTASGLYTAPTAAGSCTVTATSQADPTKSSAASVTVTLSSAGSPTLVQHVSGSNTRGFGLSNPYCYHYQLPDFTTGGKLINCWCHLRWRPHTQGLGRPGKLLHDTGKLL